MLSRSLIFVGALGASVPLRSAPKDENVLGFATNEYDILMTTDYYDGYSSQGFWFKVRSTQNNFCLSNAGQQDQNCLKGFVGSMAVVKYKIRSHSGVTCPNAMREHVPTIDQADDLAERPPVESTIELVRGIGSDIQAFVYEAEPVSSVPLPDGKGPWSLLRQDLYLGDSLTPFLVVHWKHELTAIRILDAIPCKGTSANEEMRSSRRRRRK